MMQGAHRRNIPRVIAKTNDYPAERIVLHEEAHGRSVHWGIISRRLDSHSAARKFTRTFFKKSWLRSRMCERLCHALALSQIYESLAVLYRRSGQSNHGKGFAALRLDLWRSLETKLPKSSFVQRELASARI